MQHTNPAPNSQSIEGATHDQSGRRVRAGTRYVPRGIALAVRGIGEDGAEARRLGATCVGHDVRLSRRVQIESAVVRPYAIVRVGPYPAAADVQDCSIVMYAEQSTGAMKEAAGVRAIKLNAALQPRTGQEPCIGDRTVR
jgi:hypothetical protein